MSGAAQRICVLAVAVLACYGDLYCYRKQQARK